MAQKRRVFKIAEKIRSIVAMELLSSKDPRLSLVTVTSVVVNKDLRSAKVYWTASNMSKTKEQVDKALVKASGYFRKKIAEGLGTKFVPDLKFFYDDTLDTLEEVDRLLDQVNNQSSSQGTSDA